MSFSDKHRRTHYDLLGVAQNASLEEIGKAYKRLALIYHPDRNNSPESTEQFQRLAEAHETLKDPAKRRKYDQRLKLKLSSVLPTSNRERKQQFSSNERPAPPPAAAAPRARSNSFSSASFRTFFPPSTTPSSFKPKPSPFGYDSDNRFTDRSGMPPVNPFASGSRTSANAQPASSTPRRQAPPPPKPMNRSSSLYTKLPRNDYSSSHTTPRFQPNLRKTDPVLGSFSSSPLSAEIFQPMESNPPRRPPGMQTSEPTIVEPQQQPTIVKDYPWLFTDEPRRGSPPRGPPEIFGPSIDYETRGGNRFKSSSMLSSRAINRADPFQTFEAAWDKTLDEIIDDLFTKCDIQRKRETVMRAGVGGGGSSFVGEARQQRTEEDYRRAKEEMSRKKRNTFHYGKTEDGSTEATIRTRRMTSSNMTPPNGNYEPLTRAALERLEREQPKNGTHKNETRDEEKSYHKKSSEPHHQKPGVTFDERLFSSFKPSHLYGEKYNAQARRYQEEEIFKTKVIEPNGSIKETYHRIHRWV